MNVTRGFTDLLGQLDASVDGRMTLGPDWSGEGVEESSYVALVYMVPSDGQDMSIGEDRMRVDLYGPGLSSTLDKAESLKDQLVWDKYGSSYHFVPGGMFDDVEIAVRPAPVPTDLDRVSLVSTVFIVTTRDN